MTEGNQPLLEKTREAVVVAESWAKVPNSRGPLDLETMASGLEEADPAAAETGMKEKAGEDIAKMKHLSDTGAEENGSWGGAKAWGQEERSSVLADRGTLAQRGCILSLMEGSARQAVGASSLGEGVNSTGGGSGKKANHLAEALFFPCATQHVGKEHGAGGQAATDMHSHIPPASGPLLSDPSLQRQPLSLGINQPMIPNLNGLDPRSLASSTWFRAETSRWAAPSVAGVLDASTTVVSLVGTNPLSMPHKPLEVPKPLPPSAAVLPVPEDLAARASGAWHASLGHHGLPSGTQGATSGLASTNLALGTTVFAGGEEEGRDLPQKVGNGVLTLPTLGSLPDWFSDQRQDQAQLKDTRVSDKPSWLSLDLTSSLPESLGTSNPHPKSNSGTDLSAWKFPSSQRLVPGSSPFLQALQTLAPGGESVGRHLAASGNAAQLVEERLAWYEQFKANVSNIAASSATIPASTWALVQGAPTKLPSPVLPSPLQASGPFLSATDSTVRESQGETQGPEGGRREADLLSRMEGNETGGLDQGAFGPPVAHAAGLIFGGAYNAVVEAARSKALKELNGIALPCLLANTEVNQVPHRTPPLLNFPTLSSTPPSLLALEHPSGVFNTSHSRLLHELRMEPLKPLMFPTARLPDRGGSPIPPANSSPPSFGGSSLPSLSLRGWAARSGASSVASLDVISPGGGTRKRSIDDSDSGGEVRLGRQRSFDLARKRQKGPRGQSQEPSTKLTLEVSSGGEQSRGGGSEILRARMQSSPQALTPGPSTSWGLTGASAAASTAYAAYLDSIKAGASLSNLGGPVRTTTETPNSSGSQAASAIQNGARMGARNWRSSSGDTWVSKEGGEQSGERPLGRGELRVADRHNTVDGLLEGDHPVEQLSVQRTDLGVGMRREEALSIGSAAASRAGLNLGAVLSPAPPSSGTGEGGGRSMASILGGYKAKLPGWPDKAMPADEYLEALQSRQFRLNVEVQEQASPGKD